MIKRIISLLLFFLILSACGQNKDDNGYAVGVFSQEQSDPKSDPRYGIMGGPDEDDDQPVTDSPAESAGMVIFYNGPILTMNDAQPTAEAIAIENGKIVAVGGQDEVFAYQTDDTLMVDLDGRTLMPGFVDGHSHMFTQYGNLGGSIDAVQQQVLASGITTMADMGGGRGEIIDQLREMEANGELRMRVSMYLNQVSVCGENFGYWYEDYPQSIEPGALVHVPGVKIFLDGGACNRPARTVGDLGDLYFSLEEATQIISDIDARGYQAAVHALGDRAVEQVLQAMNTVIGDSGNPMRHRIEHNASVRPELVPLYSDSKPVAMIFGGSVACWWAGTSDRWETAEGESLAWEWPTAELMAANPDVVFAWHQDVPVWPLGAIEKLWGFVTRKQIAEDGTICEPPDFALDDTIPVKTALK
ncbi:MAG: amidohydrolase family protein, partial [Anaerolineales bacterium]